MWVCVGGGGGGGGEEEGRDMCRQGKNRDMCNMNVKGDPEIINLFPSIRLP